MIDHIMLLYKTGRTDTLFFPDSKVQNNLLQEKNIVKLYNSVFQTSGNIWTLESVAVMSCEGESL